MEKFQPLKRVTAGAFSLMLSNHQQMNLLPKYFDSAFYAQAESIWKLCCKSQPALLRKKR